MSIEIKISKDFEGVKPKNFLKKKLNMPYYKIPKLLKDKRITLNGKKIKQEDVLREGDILKIWPSDITLREEKKNFREKKDLGIKTIFENDDFIVLNKLPGVVVQGSQEKEFSLSLHLAYLKDKNKDNSDFEYFHVHRLDKDTSGVLVVAKNRQTLRDFNKLFRTREVKKIYHAIVVGNLENKTGRVEVLMKKNPDGSREKMSISKKDEKGLRNSISNYKVLKEFEKNAETFSLVEVNIETGVTHQIRVHMKYLGNPILGDKMYGISTINKDFEGIISRQMLHAKSLNFEYKGEKYSFEVDYPEDFFNFLNN
jgi:23S rRNA pseudouridine1911/1915/1917 synthase